MAEILRDLSGAKVCKSCRSRQELSNEYLLAKIGVDTAENEPLQVQLIFKQLLSDLIFTEPPRPSGGRGEGQGPGNRDALQAAAGCAPREGS